MPKVKPLDTYIPKKKRLFLGAFILAAVLAGWYFGYALTLIALVLLFILLGTLYGLRYALAHAGLSRLAEYAPKYSYPVLLKAAQEQQKDPNNFTFVVLGDNRNVQKTAVKVYGEAAKEGAALIFNTGDIVRHGTPREYLKNHIKLLEMVEPIPVFCIPGNHERGARRDFGPFKALYGAERFSFDYGACRFIGFNNGKRSRVDADDLAFVERELEKSPAPPYKYVFLHIPPRYFEDHIVIVNKRRGYKKYAGELHNLFIRHGVNEVFMGHIHGYVSEKIDGVRYTLTAGAGAPLSKRLRPEYRYHNYVVVHISPQGIRREAVRLKNGQWQRSDEPV